MSQIVADEKFLEHTRGGTRFTELCDETEKVLGYFIPQAEYVRLLQDFARHAAVSEDARMNLLADLAAGRCASTEQVLEQSKQARRSRRLGPDAQGDRT